MASKDSGTDLQPSPLGFEDPTQPELARFEIAETKQDPVEIFRDLIQAARDPRKQKSLSALKQALDFMRKTGATDYSVASVARGIAVLGFKGPKAQSMRNSEGRDFKKLIRAYEEAANKRKKPGRSSDEDDIAAAIPDLRIAAQVRWVMNENRALKRRNDLLHAEFKRLPAIQAASSSRVLPNSGRQFTEGEVQAVRKFLLQVREIEFAFDPQSGALVHERHGFEVAPPGFHQTLMKILNGAGS